MLSRPSSSVLCSVWLPVLLLGLTLTLYLTMPRQTWAASASTAPHTGLEGGMGRSYGPDVEERAGKNNMPQTSMPMDAYGNPITGEMPDQPAPKARPGAGAYGGYNKGPKATPRPLPDPPARPKWSF